jgi:hypothetical protein
MIARKTLPTVTENGFSQARHLYKPGRVDLPLSNVTSFTVPQCGQIFGLSDDFKVLADLVFVVDDRIGEVNFHGQPVLTTYRGSPAAG